MGDKREKVVIHRSIKVPSKISVGNFFKTVEDRVYLICEGDPNVGEGLSAILYEVTDGYPKFVKVLEEWLTNPSRHLLLEEYDITDIYYGNQVQLHLYEE